LKSKPEFSLGVLKKYVATQDAEVLNAIYGHYKEKLTTKPAPQIRVVKSMLYLLSRTGSELPNTNSEGFVEARFINELESTGFFVTAQRLSALLDRCDVSREIINPAAVLDLPQTQGSSRVYFVIATCVLH
jgi:hypothetical protein